MKSVLQDTDAALEKAAREEDKLVETKDEKYRKTACLYFKRAMINDGNKEYNEKII